MHIETEISSGDVGVAMSILRDWLEQSRSNDVGKCRSDTDWQDQNSVMRVLDALGISDRVVIIPTVYSYQNPEAT
jgi:hypothetical protein